MSVRKLEKKRRHAEDDLILFSESPHGYIYTRSSNNHVLGYEVFEKRIQPAETKTIDGRQVTLPDREKYPGSSDFGNWAWYTRSKDRAYQLLVDMTNKAKEKEALAAAVVASAPVEAPVISPPPVPSPLEQPIVNSPAVGVTPSVEMPQDEGIYLGLFA